MVRSYKQTFDYSIQEYLFIGVFYGMLLLIIIYNLVYYIMLRKAYYLFYITYVATSFLYLTQKDGTGFQVLWPNFPWVSSYIPISCLALGTIAMFMFFIQFVQIQKQKKALRTRHQLRLA